MATPVSYTHLDVYKRQRLHRMIYVAGAAACIHFWWLVKAGVRTPWKDTAVLAVLLLARVVYLVVKRVRKRGAPVAVQQAV